MFRSWSMKSAGLGICFISILAMQSGCSKEAAKEASTSQTIAKASGVEITVHELRHGLGGTKTNIENEKRFLESMVDQTLMAKKAIEAGLEKDPKVLMSIAAARRAILAQALAEKISGPGATATEVARLSRGNLR